MESELMYNVLYLGSIGIMIYIMVFIYLFLPTGYIRKSVKTEYDKIEEELYRYVGKRRCMEVINSDVALVLKYGIYGSDVVTILLDKYDGVIGITYKLNGKMMVVLSCLRPSEVKYLEDKLLNFKEKHDSWRRNE